MEWREWAPLDHVLARVPALGKYGRDQSVTAVAAAGDILALGTDTGAVFWYSRGPDTLRRLDCWPGTPVTCLALVQTVDMMLAAGSREGDLAILQVPRPVQAGPGGVPFPGTAQSVQQFSIKSVHARTITCLKWSNNGEKLFSGDLGGRVAASSIDFVMNEVSSRTLSNETCKIISLDYQFVDYQMRVLLVSTLSSTFAYNFQSGSETKLVRIGQKSREPGTFASTCLQTGVGRAGLKLVVVRPNDRVWISDLEGRVEKTVILAGSIRRCHAQVPIINPSNMAPDEKLCFERVAILSASKQVVLLWSASSLHIVSLLTGALLASCNALRNILAVAVTSEREFFVLETGRSVIRIGLEEDSLTPVKDWRRSSTVSQGADTDLHSALEDISSKITRTLPQIDLFKTLSANANVGMTLLKTRLSGGVSVPSPDPRSPSPEVVEALLGLDYNKPAASRDIRAVLELEKPADREFRERMNRIGEADYEEQISRVKTSPRLSKSSKRLAKGKEVINDAHDDEDVEAVLQAHGGFNVSDLKNSLEKEETLMKMLNLSAVEEIDAGSKECVDELTDSNPSLLDSTKGEMDDRVVSSDVDKQDFKEKSNAMTPLPDPVDDGNDDGKVSSLLSIGYGPPSGSSNLTASLPSADREARLEETHPDEEAALVVEAGGQDQVMEVEGEAVGDGWRRYEVPGPCQAVWENQEQVWLCDNRDQVFYSRTRGEAGTRLEWRRAEFSASSVVTSPCGRVLWRLHRHTAFCLAQGDPATGAGDWSKLADSVASLWLGAAGGWLVKLDGGLVHHPALGPATPASTRARQLYTGRGLASVVEAGGRLVARTLPAADTQLLSCPLDQLSCEAAWVAVPRPASGHGLGALTLGPGDTLWVTDTAGGVHVSRDTGDTWSSLHVPGELDPVSGLCLPVLVPGVSRLWVAAPLASSLLAHPWPLPCYTWARLAALSSQLTSVRVKTLHGGGWDTWGGGLLASTYGGPLLELVPGPATVTALPLPPHEAVAAVSCVPGTSWLLTVSGKVFIRSGPRPAWTPLCLAQLGGARLVSLSIAEVGGGLAWAVDSEGGVLLRLGSLAPPPPHAAPPAWLPVDTEGVAPGARLVEVVCSGAGDKVWARDSDHGVYTRQGVFPAEHPVGSGWVAVTGVAVAGLTASSCAVWAVSGTGRLYTRAGLGATDWAGSSWRGVPGPRAGDCVAAVTSGQCGTVWAVDTRGGLHQLAVTELGRDPGAEEEGGWVTV